MLFLLVLLIVNSSIPFAGVGDDVDYFNASIRKFNSIGDWFDLTQFQATHEQGGYPLLLSWVHQFAGGSLYHRKALNVACFLLLAQVWFGIGSAVGGPRLAFVYAWGILLATPLWFYWLFLLKDIVIVLLQSLLIAGLVYSMRAGSRATGYMLVAISTLFVIPFRSMLAFLNLAMIAVAAFLAMSGRRKLSSRVVVIAMASTLIIGVLTIGSRPDLLEKFGVFGEGGRSVDVATLEENIDARERVRSRFGLSLLKFPFVYLVGEVAAFNPRSWGGDTARLIRAVSVVPWIYFGLPLFLVGTWLTIRKGWGTVSQAPPVVEVRRSSLQIDGRQLILFLAFVLLYAAVSWLAVDTTRWRMSSFPPMIAIAGVAWISMPSRKRINMLLVWSAFLTALVAAYYGLFK